MLACTVVRITTPEKYTLSSLWFGPSRPRRAVVFVHGLSGSAFSMLGLVEKLVDAKTSVLTFNNRGAYVVSRMSKKTKKKGKPKYGGAAHEVFTDCVDDIDGAIRYARKQGAKEIYLAGHSTGCQKSVYWAAKRGRGVKGLILLAPVSDWAAEMKRSGKKKIARAAAAAHALVKRGKGHELLPNGLWREMLDAQRFLSLYSPESIEEIFSYAQPKKHPRFLAKTRLPILVLWAGDDEYSSHPTRDITHWFEAHVRSRAAAVRVIPKARHSFKGTEQVVARAIRTWVRG